MEGSTKGNVYVSNGAVSGASNDNNFTSKPNPPQAANPIMGLNSDLDMDRRKIKRVMLNRISAQKSRAKKMQYLADLELQVNAFQGHVANLISQVQSYENQKLRIMRENDKLDCEMAMLMEQTLLRENEIENSRLELNALKEVYIAQQEYLQALMLPNSHTSLEPMNNDQVSNYNYQVSGNGEENVDLPPTQSQIWATDVQNEHEANLNLANQIGTMEILAQNAKP